MGIGHVGRAIAAMRDCYVEPCALVTAASDG